MKQGVVAAIVGVALLAAPVAGAQGTSAKPADTKMGTGVDTGARSLGTVRLSRSVKANGEVLVHRLELEHH